ncbi:hypothetical protein VUR80DRAFT_9005 [Thermomyces stellatus]
MPTIKPISIDDVVFVAAGPEQRELTWRINHATWANTIPVEEHIRSQEALARTPHATSSIGGRTSWVLHLKGDPLNVVAAVDSISKEAFVKDGKGVRLVKAYGVGSVHTAPEYRKQGMAGHMLGRLQEVMDTDGEFSVLYSDIGTEYYGKFGWVAYPSLQVSAYLEGNKPEKPAGVKFLSRDEMKPYCERDVGKLREKMESLPDDGRTHVAFLPSFEQLDWQFTRDELSAGQKGLPKPTSQGAATEDDSSWLYWHHDLSKNMLVIHRVVADSDEAVRDLLLAAVAEAGQTGLATVVAWNPEGLVEDGARLLAEEGEGVRVRFESRETYRRPCLRWKGGANEGVVWEDNQYYAWC